MLWNCYVDEAGCTGVLPALVSDIQPVLVISGIMVDQTRLHQLTIDFLNLKRRFFPGAVLPTGAAPAGFLDWMLVEIKGAEVRRQLADPRATRRRHAVGFLDKLVGLMDYHQVRLTGRLFVKGVGVAMKGTAIYSATMQDICRTFHHFLGTVNAGGIIIADSRNKEQNTSVAHSIFTQKFKQTGDDHCRILEMPTFGHSENHAGIQIADLLCSALLFPMAIDAYCEGRITSCHVRPGSYRVLRTRFGATLRRLQHRYQEAGTGSWRGGIRVEDRLGNLGGGELFRVSPPAPVPVAVAPRAGAGRAGP